MAVARKIKTLLTVNILVFVGIILFSVYCRLQDRSEALVQVVRGADRRMRNRLSKASALADREAILQRLDHLEEVVYNQLNGEPRYGGEVGSHARTLLSRSGRPHPTHNIFQGPGWKLLWVLQRECWEAFIGRGQ